MGSFLAGIVADFAQHWPLYVSIPVVAALIGYGTKLVALRMMFQPVEFIGVKPFFGWQDIVREGAGHYQPGLWESLPVRVQRLVIERVQHESPRMVAAVLDLIKSDVDCVIALKGMEVTSLLKDTRLQHRIFQ